MEENDVLKKFGFNVKLERMKQDLTQAQFAEILGVHEKYISRIERGKQNLTIKKLNALAKALKIDLYKLLKF